ncbi:hypothetical protein FO519_008714 [Halicephalobus sp. NKZ332]|nr:hypothetical protein FO519_008714 [Halicephalobus sp. NKZ332]
MTHRIGDELDEQSEMLDDLGTAMMDTETRMDNVMKKIAKISKLDDVQLTSDPIADVEFARILNRSLPRYFYFFDNPKLFVTNILFLSLLTFTSSTIPDPSGYVTFCPCMGRFGNQMEQYLGAISFAKQLNRTLILPPIVEYPPGQSFAKMIELENVFEVKELEKFARVIPMGKFMRDLGPTIWPEGKRVSFCWSPRKSIYDETAEPSCNAKEGNPFGPFWDHSGINFVRDEYYSEKVASGTDIGRWTAKKEWDESYPPSEFPVIAFTGSPGSFPIKDEDRYIQKYLKFRPRITDKAIKFIKENLPRPFVGIHLRNNLDWDNVCKSLRQGQKMDHLFASPQCLGYYNEHGRLTLDICQPSEEKILEEVEDVVNSIGAKAIFVSSDRDHLIPELNEKFKNKNIKAHKLQDNDPYISLAILQRSDHFIGNCVSTFSSFVTRSREFGSRQDLKKTSFFGFKPLPTRKIEL